MQKLDPRLRLKDMSSPAIEPFSGYGPYSTMVCKGRAVHVWGWSISKNAISSWILMSSYSNVSEVIIEYYHRYHNGHAGSRSAFKGPSGTSRVLYIFIGYPRLGPSTVLAGSPTIPRSHDPTIPRSHHVSVLMYE